MGNKPIRASAVVLARGKSTRFGADTDKTLLTWRGISLVERAVRECLALRSLFEEIGEIEEILLAGNADAKFSLFSLPGVREIKDVYRGSGPLGGIHAGLFCARNGTVFVTACDMPFFQAKLARRLLELSDGYDAVVPVDGGRPQPLCAVYKKSVLPAAEALLLAGERSVRGLYSKVRTRYAARDAWGDVLGILPEEQDVFFNINDREDYRRLLARDAEKENA
jgi:molybdopterin-guanine dinucleotide biosynthesis protein A